MREMIVNIQVSFQVLMKTTIIFSSVIFNIDFYNCIPDLPFILYHLWLMPYENRNFRFVPQLIRI